MHVYQMRSSIQSVVEQTQERLQVCMNALKEVSKVWLVAKMVHTLFESILGNKMLEERLQKAPGKRHKKIRLDRQPPSAVQEDQQKRRYDDLELGYANGPPVPQVSYERSRPQTPAVTPSRDLCQAPPNGSMAAPSTVSPTLRQTNDAFLGAGASRSTTRPPTPFSAMYAIPATPPDLYLVTRNSPPISQTLWENFQPDQLFPDGANISFQHPFQMSHPPNLDPQLQMSQIPTTNMSQVSMQGHQQLPQRNMRGSQDAGSNSQGGISNMPQQQTAAQLWPPQTYSDSQEDNWSNSSRGQSGVSVPATLNVEDW